MKTQSVTRYLFFFIPTLIAVLIFWYFIVNGNLYYCSDKTPVIDFIPPFVHKESVSDYYIASESTVYIIWFICVAIVAILPAFLTKLIKNVPKTI